MLFNSYGFVFLFLPVVLLGFVVAGRRGPVATAAWLGAASLAFYGYWNPHYLPLLLGSILVNFLFGGAIARAVGAGHDARAARLLLAGITANLATLGYFKYAAFLVRSFDAATGLSLTVPNIVLPLGISFFTFTQIAFLVDVRRGLAREYSAVNYLLFVTYFPHLIAGPIIHHKEMMPQFARAGAGGLRPADTALGLSAFALGLFKKVVIADALARYASPVFAVAATKDVLFYEAWIGALAYTLQLYFDFSAYSDMAVGLSLLFGIRLPVNFNSPYKSRSITDFWRRWHMTLSRFLRDYVYIPLGGNRLGERRRFVNLLATMLLGGFWHGASWTFVAWGGLHGLYLVVHHWWASTKLAARLQPHAAWRTAAWALTFLCVVVGWVFFRAETFAGAGRLLRAMAGVDGVLHFPEQLRPAFGRGAALIRAIGGDFRFGSVPLILDAPLWIVPGLVIALRLPNVQELLGAARIALVDERDAATARGRLRWRPTARWAVLLGAAAAFSLLCMQDAGEFLYYQF